MSGSGLLLLGVVIVALAVIWIGGIIISVVDAVRE